MIKKVRALLICTTIILFLALSTFVPAAGAAGSEPGVTLDWVRYALSAGSSSSVDQIRPDGIPAVDNQGNVYTVHENGFFYCIKPDGTMKWKVNLHYVGEYRKIGGAGPVLDQNGNCYIGSGDSRVYAVDPEGNVLWTYKMKNEVATGTSPALVDDTLYVVDISQNLYAIDLTDGTEKWRQHVKGAWNCITPVVDNKGTIYVASYYWISAIDADGSIKWVRDLDMPVHMYGVSGKAWDGEQRMAVSADGDTIYLITDLTNDLNKNRIYALNTEDGTDKWVKDVFKMLSSPAFYQDMLFYTTSDCRLHVLDAATGDEKWEYYADDAEYIIRNYYYKNAPVIDRDGTIYVSIGGNLYSITQSGEKKWVFSDEDIEIITVSRPGPNGELYCVALGGQRLLIKLIDNSIDQVPAELNIDEENFGMLVGGEYSPKVVLKDIYNHAMGVSGLQWESSNPDVAAVDNNGRVTALQAGNADITVTCPENPGLTDTVNIEVLGTAEGLGMEILPASPEVLVGKNVQLSISISNSQGLKIKEDNIEWISTASPVAVVSDDGKVTGIQSGDVVIKARVRNYPLLQAEINVKVKDFKIEQVSKEDIGAALRKTINCYYANPGQVVGDDWAAVAINAAGESVNNFEYQGQTYLEALAEKIKDKGVGSLMTDYERTTLGIVSAGGDPTNFEGINLIDEIANWPSLSQGINAAIWGLIALDGANAVVSEDAKNTRETLIEYILDNTSGDGWAFGGGTIADVDMTGMALYALAPYRDRPDVKAAGEKAIQWLSEVQNIDGKFGSWGSLNSESCAQAIMGITAWGVDPQGPLFTKEKGNLVTALLSYQTDSGSFKHIDTEDFVFATNQGLQALAALNEFYEKGYSSIFYKIRAVSTENLGITELKIVPDGLELEKEKEVVLKAKNQDGILINNELINWSTTNDEIATIDETGKLITIKEGTVNILARLKDDLSIVDQISVKVVGQEFAIEKLEETQDISGNLSFKVKNITAVDKSAVCIFILYEKNTNKVIDQSYVYKDFAPGEERIIKVSFNVPSEGEYGTRVMIWNDWLRGRPLTDSIVE